MNRYFEVMRRQLNILGEKPVFSYLTILLLQLKVVWGMWHLRDLTSGDTSLYFARACGWYQQLRGESHFSPLYTAFYATFRVFSSDAYAVTIVHRLVIVLVLAVLVLALMRRLLPPGMAWLMAAWWVVLPVDFDAVVEVHQFALIPLVSALVIIAAKPGPWGRGWGIAILLVEAALVRNEYVVATACFAAVALGWEIARWRRRQVSLVALGKTYGLPLLLAVLTILLFAVRSTFDPHKTQALLTQKQGYFIGQGYAYSYQQRHPEWRGSPWVGFRLLMTEKFGSPMPNFSQALRTNPRAMLEHMLWNTSLIPNGLQVLLFNATSGTVSPDFVPVKTRSLFALVMSVLAIAVLAIGGVLLYRRRPASCREGPLWAWIGMLCTVPMAIAVSLVLRPRPEYIFSAGLLLRAAIGACLVAIASWTEWYLIRRNAVSGRSDTKTSRSGESMEEARSTLDIPSGHTFPIVAVSLILLAPMYFHWAPSKRPLLKDYRRLQPYRESFAKPLTRFVSRRWADSLCFYLSESRLCTGVKYPTLNAQFRAGASWAQVLKESEATLFYADEAVLNDATGLEFADNAAKHGWKVIARTRSEHANWSLLAFDESADIVAADGRATLGRGWYALMTGEGQRFRWVDNDAEIEVRPMRPGPWLVEITLEPGPGLDGRPLELQAVARGNVLWSGSIVRRETVRIPLPGNCSGLLFHVVGSPRKRVNTDPRILNFRVFDLSVE